MTDDVASMNIFAIIPKPFCKLAGKLRQAYRERNVEPGYRKVAAVFISFFSEEKLFFLN